MTFSKRLCWVIVALATYCSAIAQGLAGTYVGTYEGSPVKLVLQVTAQEVSGNLHDGVSNFAISGYAQGNYLVGAATETNSNIQAIVAAELKGNTLDLALTADGVNSLTISLQRTTAAANTPPANNNAYTNNGKTPNASSQSVQGNVEPRLVGTWVRTVNNSSGYGSNSAYFTTEILFQINADGTFEYGASRSVGGGSDWSYDGSQWSAPEMSGVLRSDGKNIHVIQAQGQAVPASQQNMGTYYIDGYNMATTSASGVKEYWQKR